MHKKHALHPSVTLATYVVHADASVQQHCSPSDQTVAVSIASCKAPEAGAATDTNACMHKAVAACHSCVLVSSGASLSCVPQKQFLSLLCMFCLICSAPAVAQATEAGSKCPACHEPHQQQQCLPSNKLTARCVCCKGFAKLTGCTTDHPAHRVRPKAWHIDAVCVLLDDVKELLHLQHKAGTTSDAGSLQCCILRQRGAVPRARLDVRQFHVCTRHPGLPVAQKPGSAVSRCKEPVHPACSYALGVWNHFAMHLQHIMQSLHLPLVSVDAHLDMAQLACVILGCMSALSLRGSTRSLCEPVPKQQEAPPQQ